VATHPVGEAKESDGAGVGDCGDELGAGDVGAERRLHDAVVEAQDAPPQLRAAGSLMALQVCCVRIRGRAMIGCGGNASGWGWGGPELVARRGRRCSSPGYDGELRGDGSRPRRSATSGTRGAALVLLGVLYVLLRGKSRMKMGHFLKDFFSQLNSQTRFSTAYSRRVRLKGPTLQIHESFC